MNSILWIELLNFEWVKSLKTAEYDYGNLGDISTFAYSSVIQGLIATR